MYGKLCIIMCSKNYNTKSAPDPNVWQERRLWMPACDSISMNLHIGKSIFKL